jgi:hypothetical protein
MSCCGHKRSAWQAESTRRRTHEHPNAKRAPAPEPSRRTEPEDATLRYEGGAALSLQGPRSGRVYHVDRAGAVIAVDENDVDSLLRTRLFTRHQR